MTCIELMAVLEERGCRMRCAADDPVARVSAPFLRFGELGWYAPPGGVDGLTEEIETHQRELRLILAAMACHEIAHHTASGPSWVPFLHRCFPHHVDLVGWLLTPLPLEDW